MASAGDVNADGCDDLVVGRFLASGPDEHQGRADLYLGSATGLGTEPAWTVRGEPHEGFGLGVAGIGDVDGDGFDDVVVLASRCGELRGCLSLFRGGAAGLSATPSWTFQRGLGVTWTGGAPLAAAGDVDHDGFDDFLVGGPDGPERDSGTVWWFRGGPDGPGAAPAWEVHGEAGERLGHVVAGAGDVDGDGYADLLAGGAGGARVWLGSASGPRAEWRAPADAWGRRPGWAAAGAGDVNGDGYGDVVLADPGLDTPAARSTQLPRPPDERPAATAAGRVVVFLGSPSGLTQAPAWAIEGSTNREMLGAAVIGAGDLDADGFADLAIGAPGLGRGAFAVFTGGPDGPSRTPSLWVTGTAPEEALGSVLASAGDLDGDGRTELSVGAPGAGDDSPDRRVSVYRLERGARPLREQPAGLFAPSDAAPPAPDPWRDNVIARDWPYECAASGFHGPLARRIPPERWIRGRDYLQPGGPPRCEGGASTPIGWDEIPAGATSPAAALAAWNSGTIRIDWCGHAWPPATTVSAARPDPGVSAKWQFVGWSDAPDREVLDCPWRQVLLVPVLVDVGGGATSGTLPLWLVVTSASPADWTLLQRGAAEVSVDAAGVAAWRAAAPAEAPAPAFRMAFSTGAAFGHRLVTLEAAAGSSSVGLDGTWRWTVSGR